MLEQLSSPDPRSRECAIELLTGCGNWRTSSTYIRRQYLEGRNSGLPDWGCEPDIVVQKIRARLNDDCLDVRFAAARALEEFSLHVSETVPVFIDGLQHGENWIQNYAALHLGRIGQSALAAIPFLEEAQHSSYERTRLAARNAIARIQGSEKQ